MVPVMFGTLIPKTTWILSDILCLKMGCFNKSEEHSYALHSAPPNRSEMAGERREIDRQMDR